MCVLTLNPIGIMTASKVEVEAHHSINRVRKMDVVVTLLLASKRSNMESFSLLRRYVIEITGSYLRIL